MGYEVLGHQVLKVERQNSHVIKTHFCFFKKVTLSVVDNSVEIGLMDWQDNSLDFEPVSIRITGESALGEMLEPFVGICEDGTIDLSGYVAGDKLTIVTLNENVENATLEVVI